MKKNFKIVLVVAGVLLLPFIAFGSGGFLGVHQEATSADGGAISTSVLDTTTSTSVQVAIDNSTNTAVDGGSTYRTADVDWIAADGTTVLFRKQVNVNHGSRGLIQVSADAVVPGSEPTGVTHVTVDPGKKMKVTLEAQSDAPAAASVSVDLR